jgi:hypothetical protein
MYYGQLKTSGWLDWFKPAQKPTAPLPTKPQIPMSDLTGDPLLMYGMNKLEPAPLPEPPQPMVVQK